MKITGRCEITILKGMKAINVSRNKLIYVVAIRIFFYFFFFLQQNGEMAANIAALIFNRNFFFIRDLGRPNDSFLYCVAQSKFPLRYLCFL